MTDDNKERFQTWLNGGPMAAKGKIEDAMGKIEANLLEAIARNVRLECLKLVGAYEGSTEAMITSAEKLTSFVMNGADKGEGDDRPGVAAWTAAPPPPHPSYCSGTHTAGASVTITAPPNSETPSSGI